MPFSIRSLLRRSKDNAPRLVDEGIAAERAADPARALACYEAAIAADASYAPAHMNRGIALAAAGRTDDAIACYEQAIALDAGYAAAYCNLALAHHARKEWELARAAFEAALRQRADDPEVWVGLARVLEAAGRDEEALDALRKAVALRDDHTGALHHLGTILHRLRRFGEAATHDRRLLELEPENAFVGHRLGQALRELGLVTEAEAALRQALLFSPDDAGIATALGLLLNDTDRPVEAIPWLVKSVAGTPRNAVVRCSLALALRGTRLNVRTDLECRVLRELCMDDDVSPLFLSVSVLDFISRHESYPHLRAIAAAGDDYDLADDVQSAFLLDPLLLAALPRMPFTDDAMEGMLTHLRRHLLLRTPADGSPPTHEAPLPFLCALARNCFFSGYAWFVDAAERDRLEALRARLELELAHASEVPATLEMSLATFAAYASLHTLAAAARLLDLPHATWSAPFAPLIVEQIADRRREQALAAALPAVSPIADATSVAVRAQYEENPFPRWVGAPNTGVETYDALWQRLHKRAPAFVTPRPVPVLVAGCGTGHHPVMLARKHPDAEILAVDLSRASLGYAARMTAKLGLANVHYCQGDILELAALKRRFALIECAGVLHHLNDPMAGWRVLRGLLEPSGLMRIALYSERARADLVPAREFIAELGLAPTAEGMRESRRAIMSLPRDHPARAVAGFRDFYTLDEFRDLLLHVREHRFTLPQIGRCLEELGLRLLQIEVPAETRSRFAAAFPGRNPDTDLAAWDRFEEANPKTFISMYVFWCCPATLSYP